MKWISVYDKHDQLVKDKLPKHGQHVLVWSNRDNIYPFPSGHNGDDGEGRQRMYDTVFYDEKVSYFNFYGNNKSLKDFEDYITLNGPRYKWSDCDYVTHWMELPKPPENFEVNPSIPGEYTEPLSEETEETIREFGKSLTNSLDEILLKLIREQENER